MEIALARVRDFIILPISLLRLWPHILIGCLFDKDKLTRSDIARWAEIYDRTAPNNLISFIYEFTYFMTYKKEYRNVFYVRIWPVDQFISWLCPPLESLEISSRNIGPGLFIQHGIATLVSAERIGANCWINQQVTIGFSNATDRPTIGDNVKIHAGAKLVGKITVGDNAVIGLNTVVISNVPANSTVFGVPGRHMWNRNMREQS